VPRDIVVVSDLHVGAHDDPFYDGAFARFLDHVGETGAELLLLGDALDFVEARPRAIGRRTPIDTSERAACATLEWIARRHQAFFDAIAGYVGRGRPVHVVPGNHDLELMRTSAQTRFCELVARGGRSEDRAGAVVFHPWIFYVPGLLYAEHGHQHHDINAVDTLLQPEDPDRPGQLALPLASHLVAGRPRFALRAARHAVHLSGSALARRRAEYRRHALAPETARVPLPAATLGALDRLSEARPSAILGRLLRQAVRRRPGQPTQQGGYLHAGATAVDRVLQESGAAVPHLAFGHTHIAERFPVHARAEYINCGTWSPFVPRGLDPAGGRLTFARVSPGGGARVLRWDDASRRPVSLPGG
jgi:UDP-2,3-diacylglucosamine pyrophosphatase LpxH